MFKSGFSSQSGGTALWDVEELGGLEDVVDCVDGSEDPGDARSLPSASPFFFTSLLEANDRWLRGCKEESLYCHPTLASRRLGLRYGRIDLLVDCEEHVSYWVHGAPRVTLVILEDLTGAPIVCMITLCAVPRLLSTPSTQIIPSASLG